MTNSKIEDFSDWLRDAHAMEEQAEQLFSGQADRFDDYPSIGNRLQAEAERSKEFQRLLTAQIEKLGTSTSTIKDVAGKVVATAQNLVGTLMTDEPVKGVLALHTFVQMEIGSFKILKAAASASNKEDIATICNTVLEQLTARASWLDEELDDVTRTFLARKAA